MIDTPFEVRPLRMQLAPLVFGVILMAIAGYFVPQDHTVPGWLRVLVPVGCALGIALVGAFWWKSRERRIVVDRQGIREVGLFGTREIAWDAITRYRYLSLPQTALAHGRGGGGVIGLVTGAMEEKSASEQRGRNRYFGLGHIELYTSNSTKPFRIGKHPFLGPRGGYVELSDLMDRVLDELHERFATATPSFAPFTLDATTLRSDRSAIEISDIAVVSLARGRLRIASKTRGEWATTPMKTVDNSMLLVHELASRGILLQVSPDVFVPRTTMPMVS